MLERLTDIIARETFGESCKSRKYDLDHSEHEDPEHDSGKIWQKSAETSQRDKYINLLSISKKLASSSEQPLTYFLDGSRRVFKVDEIAYDISGRRVIYPLIAGQIGVGCCKRTDRKLLPAKIKHEIVIALPDRIAPNRINGFFQSIKIKLNESPSTAQTGIEIADVLHYNKDVNITPEDSATACIQSRMMEEEKKLTETISRKLNHNNYLIKDGSLEYRKLTNTEMQNYRWVIGISKNFNPEACKNAHGKADHGYIADIPPYHRTQAACFTNPGIFGDIKFAVWYIRLHDKSRTRSAFDGIIKVEKILATQEEQYSGTMNSDEIDTLSAYILNERMPVCYGNDFRWANHIYPVYLTETYIKSKYLSTESFLHLF